MKTIVLLTVLLLLASCASQPKKRPPSKVPVKTTVVKKETPVTNMREDDLNYVLLQREYSQWRGAPYKLGGNSKKGVDCSAFVQHIYDDSFNIKIPRSTKRQVKEGFFIYKNQLKTGDLVFFKTGWNVRHVGIYIGDNKFIHASTSKGVTTSSLNNVYWKKKYWQSRRISK